MGVVGGGSGNNNGGLSVRQTTIDEQPLRTPLNLLPEKRTPKRSPLSLVFAAGGTGKRDEWTDIHMD